MAAQDSSDSGAGELVAQEIREESSRVAVGGLDPARRKQSVPGPPGVLFLLLALSGAFFLAFVVQPLTLQVVLHRSLRRSIPTLNAPLALAKKSKNKKKDKWFICDHQGKALPALFAGVQKSGSTTTWADIQHEVWPIKLEMAKALHCPDLRNCKEPHYFDNKTKHKPMQYNELWGRCADHQKGLVVDFTPKNVYLPTVPEKVKTIYKNKYQEITFLWAFREPARRMLSAFAMTQGTGQRYFGHKGKISCEDYVNEVLERFDSKMTMHNIPRSTWLSHDFRPVVQGLYYIHVRNWLNSGFLPSQIIIYPGLMYLKHRDNLDTNPVLEAVRHKLGPNVLRPANAWHDGKKAAHVGSHADFEDVCPPHLIDKLDKKVFGPMNRKFMNLLAEQVGKGMVLVGYTGKANDVEAVTRWMTADWLF